MSDRQGRSGLRSAPLSFLGVWIAPVLALTIGVASVAHAQAWQPDLGDGRYRNPIIFADYSDPDVIRVGSDFYLTSSSFGSVPGLPVLHSTDLVNWRIVGHAIARLPAAFDTVQHGNGVWAPALRHHDGWFYIYYGDPDRGIYMVRTRNPRGAWSAPLLVHAARGWEDPCPFWDSDGHAYLVHAFAGSRAGIKSVLHVSRMSPDGTRLIGDDSLVYDGHAQDPTIEGPKLYRRHGYYYIFAPAGGVTTGWQAVLRSRNVFGPYERRVVLAQGHTAVNGPHQGAWVSLANGDDWFVHFQDRGAYGRITWLEPMSWRDDWPVIGADSDGDGTGEPVLLHAKPRVREPSVPEGPQTSDDFRRGTLGLQWQWPANPRTAWSSLVARRGWLRLFAQPLPAGAVNLWSAPNLLLQKIPAPAFTATTSVTVPSETGVVAGLVMLGMEYAYVGVRRTATGAAIVQVRDSAASRGGREAVVARLGIANPTAPIRLRVTVHDRALCTFAYAVGPDDTFHPIGTPFYAQPGRWVGASLGLFAEGTGAAASRSFADFDYLDITPENAR